MPAPDVLFAASSSLLVLAVFSFTASFISSALAVKNKQAPSITKQVLGMYLAIVFLFLFLVTSDLINQCVKVVCQHDFLTLPFMTQGLLLPIPFALIAGIPPALFRFADYLMAKK